METPILIRRAVIGSYRNTALAGMSAPSMRRGEGYEFAELRGYVNGDDPRRINWAATARAGALQTNVMLEEHALCFASIVDDAPSMQLGINRSRLAVAREACLLWNQALQTGDRCMAVSENECFEIRGVRIEVAAHACAMHELQTRDIDTALVHADAILPRGSAILVISDGYAQIDETTLHRLSARHDVTYVLARDPWHAGFPLRGLTRLRDVTTGRSARFYLDARHAQAYATAVAERERQLHTRFAQAGWRFGLLDEHAEETMRTVFSPYQSRMAASSA